MLRVIPVAGLALLSACSVTADRAAWPDPWAADEAAVETLAVVRDRGWFSGDGSFALGPYTIRPVPRSWWAKAPAQSGFSIGLGGAVIGVSKVHDESEFSFRLLAQGADVAAVRCVQFLHVENWHGGVGDNDIGSIIVEGNLAYLAKLNCEAVGFHPDWTDWRLDLRAVNQRPFFGVLKTGEKSWSVGGTQDATSGSREASTGFELREGDSILARLNRLDPADLRWRADLPQSERLALLAAVSSLLLANDPLSP